jgi:hypothetical protein
MRLEIEQQKRTQTRRESRELKKPKINLYTSLDSKPKIPLREMISRHVFKERMIRGYLQKSK